jgi:hypothetical protein
VRDVVIALGQELEIHEVLRARRGMAQLAESDLARNDLQKHGYGLSPILIRIFILL